MGVHEGPTFRFGPDFVHGMGCLRDELLQTVEAELLFLRRHGVQALHVHDGQLGVDQLLVHNLALLR